MTRRQHTISLGALFVLLIAVPAAAQIPCEDDPYGELPDCSFEQVALEDWHVDTGGFFGQLMVDPRTGSGSGEVHSVEAGPKFHDLSLNSGCFPVTPASVESSYGAWLRILESDGEDVVCYTSRSAYDDDKCSNLLNSSESPNAYPQTNGWTESAGTGALTGPFAQLEINCSSQGHFEIQIDDAYSLRPPSCLDDPNNLLPNCGFEEGDPPTGWSLVVSDFGQAVGDSFGQSTEPTLIGNGSGVATSTFVGGTVSGNFPPPNVSAVLRSCSPLPTTARRVSFGASFRLLSGNAHSCWTWLYWYESEDCEGERLEQKRGPSVVPTTGGWSQSSGTTLEEIPVTGASAELRLYCGEPYHKAQHFTVQIDEAFVVDLGIIFSDGFESGGTSAWANP